MDVESCHRRRNHYDNNSLHNTCSVIEGLCLLLCQEGSFRAFFWRTNFEKSTFPGFSGMGP